MIKVEKTEIKDLFVIHPEIFADERGYFLETYNQKHFTQEIGKIDFVQDNESKSSYGVVRGLHFQKAPFAQTKLVRVIKGKILDLAVDLRLDSTTFGKFFAIELSDTNKKQFFIPKGFAHGFSVLSEKAIVAYKVDSYYNKEADSGIYPLDKELNIDWQVNLEQIKISDKDKALPKFSEIKINR